MPCRKVGNKKICSGPRTDWWLDSMGIDWYSPGGGSEPELLGIIHYDDFTSGDLSAYTLAADPDMSSSGDGNLNLTDGVGDFTKWMQFSLASSPHRYTCLEKWTMKVRVTTPSSFTSAFGFGIGIKSANGYDSRPIIVRWAWDDATDRTVLYINESLSGQVFSATGFVASTSTQYVCRLTRNKNLYTYTVHDSTDTTQLYTYTFTTMVVGANTAFSNNTGRFTLYNFGGTFSIQELEISSLANKNLEWVTIGDSNMSGMRTDTILNRFCEIAFSGTDFEILAGVADRGTEVLLRMPEILEMNPRKAFISILRNDVASGQSSGTWQANYNSIISQLEAADIEVYLSTPIASNVSLTTAVSFVNGKPNPIADLYGVTEDGGSLNAAYNSGDNIHLNAAGQEPCSNEIITVI